MTINPDDGEPLVPLEDLWATLGYSPAEVDRMRAACAGGQS